ncbi:Hsp20/alpha crystallin family protein [Nitrosomonas sp. Nm166]|uniref:Hsp20/alpha crystallin family protein n=1 Tax=Nitrosomonas sp. Nm166 TaxID=1881054 RepID=UPI0008DEB1C5|nr:Hsp20/alpha crystallin family protein [Nitrosomonas sp. Nm166]SFF20146.1 HSP20 family protein [Nitrosomonas sp. Nm166]
MDLHKLNPWNWFKHEEPGKAKNEIVPVKYDDQSPSRSPQVNSLNQLHREIDRLFEDTFRGFGLSVRPRSELLSQFFSDDFMPAFRASVDIASDDKQYTITLEAPGLAQDDLSIELKDRVLVIKGTKQEEQEEKDQHYYRKERRYGTFERVLAVPDDADVDDIQASMNKGLLTIKIPRHEADKSNVKKITIKNG